MKRLKHADKKMRQTNYTETNKDDLWQTEKNLDKRNKKNELWQAETNWIKLRQTEKNWDKRNKWKQWKKLRQSETNNSNLRETNY